jgi:hypothetical protein
MAGIAPQYRTGPSDVFTPDDLAADAATLNNQINALDNLDWTKPSDALFNAFFAFKAEWRTWYSSTFSGWLGAFGAALNDGNRDELIQFETRFGSFAAQYAAESGNTLPGGVVAPSTGAKDTLGQQLANQLQPLLPSLDMSKVLIAVGLIAAGAVVYFFRAPLGRALSTGAA